MEQSVRKEAHLYGLSVVVSPLASTWHGPFSIFQSAYRDVRNRSEFKPEDTLKQSNHRRTSWSAVHPANSLILSPSCSFSTSRPETHQIVNGAVSAFARAPKNQNHCVKYLGQCWLLFKISREQRTRYVPGDTLM